MQHRLSHRWITVAAGLAALGLSSLLAPAALAEPEAEKANRSGEEASVGVPPPESRDPKRAVDEITVTARKREESLQKTPVSIKAFTPADLERQSIFRLEEIGALTANLKFDATTGSNNAARVYIRGFGQDDPRTLVDPGVGIYVDGVYLSRLDGGLLNLVDLERIEVLRGPQGTLYGKNTIGGAINLITAKPGNDYGAQGTFRVGNLGLIESRLWADVPIRAGPFEDRLFTRFTFATATDDGYVENEIDGGNSGDNKLLGARFSLHALPIDDLTFDFTYDWSREDERNRIGRCKITNPFSLARFVTDNYTTFADGRGSDPPSCQDSQAQWPDGGYADPMDKTDADTHFITGTFHYDLDALSLKSITGWRYRDRDNRGGDLDLTGAQFIGTREAKSDHHTVSQELNLNGSFLDERLQVTAGLYYFWEKGENRSEGDVLAQFPNAVPGEFLAPTLPTDPLGLANGGFVDYTTVDAIVAALVPTSISQGIADLNQDTRFTFENTSYAAYLQSTYSVLDNVHITGGVRYTYERKERYDTSLRPTEFATPTQRSCRNPGDTLCTHDQRQSFDQITPMANLQWDVTNDVSTYFNYARGWKSGGFSEVVLTSAEAKIFSSDQLSFDEETADTFEVGIKTAWFDRRLTLNLSAFYNLYDDIQLTRLGLNRQGTLTAFIENAAEAETRGFELEGTALVDAEWLPGDNAGILFQGGLGFIDAEYGDFDMTTFVQPTIPAGCTSLKFTDCGGSTQVLLLLAQLAAPASTTVDASDLEFKNTPEWSYNLSGTYFFDVRDWGTISTRLSWSWQSKVYYTTDNTIDQSAYGILDGRVAFDFEPIHDISGTVAFWIKNIADEEYVDGGLSLGSTVGANTEYAGRPRTYGGEITLRY